ncbi:MAG: hypothetical protein RBR47_11410 [Bacteroidales bacterium]|jgi:hypothetical protein|nr:hypothetical protein [Bacteroidales bacterium]NCU36252.1 hypothetical protein [Candidatus Falkowbacteria bacterium]MDD2633389.1 hypothetical protein [Bacteroidales bacterium]MDD3526603.1 hypothetical protein [Bacteroidales bacterium]MDD4178217.1 hypothetical protein [Bacteroidales bacterium]
MSIKGKAARCILEYAPESIRKFVMNRVIGKYGKMIEIKFDPKQKYLRASILLAGEEQPIEIKVTDYHLEKTGENTILTVLHASADREWIDLLIQNTLIGKKIKLPAGKSAMFFDILKS